MIRDYTDDEARRAIVFKWGQVEPDSAGLVDPQEPGMVEKVAEAMLTRASHDEPYAPVPALWSASTASV